MDSAVGLAQLGLTVQPAEAEAAARQPDLPEAHRAQLDITSEERAELEFLQLLLQEELMVHPEALEEVVDQR